MKDSQMMIATSISPNRVQQQIEALNTWLNQGFHVVSLNAEDEITLLEKQVHQIQLISVDRNARDFFHKPLIYISDIIRYLQIQESEIVGIINSDIYLKEKNNFAYTLEKFSKNSVVLISRINISSLSDLNGATYNYGFDAFFIDQQLLHFFPESQYCLGIPWWDYWFPLIAMKKGLNLKLMQNQKLYHLEHNINYDMEIWRKMGIKFAEEFIPGTKTKLITMLLSDINCLDDNLGKFITESFLDILYNYSENI